jgi:hypothetical protein
MCYHILKYKVPYKEPGEHYLDTRKKDRIAKNCIKRLTSLGYEVTLKEAAWTLKRRYRTTWKKGRSLLVVKTPNLKLTSAGHKDKTMLPSSTQGKFLQPGPVIPHLKKKGRHYASGKLIFRLIFNTSQ